MSRTADPAGPDACVVLTAIETGQPADDLATGLVEQRLAGCVQRTTAHSVYRWEGRVERTREDLLWIKTTADRAPAVVEWLQSHHPYELPEIVVLPITGGSAAYLDWLAGSVT